METHLRLLSLSIGLSVRKLSNSSLLAIICQICFSIMGMIASRTAMAFCWVDKIFNLKIFLFSYLWIHFDPRGSNEIHFVIWPILFLNKKFLNSNADGDEILLTLTVGLCEDHLVWICDFPTFYWILDLKKSFQRYGIYYSV